jgi:hypothetical protein
LAKKRARKASSICERKILKDLDRELYDFAIEVRDAIRRAIDAYAQEDISDDNDRLVRVWVLGLAALIYDVSMSVLLLLSHGERRAPVVLNRSIFEYQIRLRYYLMRPDKAREALAQLPERLKRIMRADPTWRSERSSENITETEDWLSERERITRENFKDDILKTVVGEQRYIGYYDGFYGKASSLVHGFETIMRDVHRDFFVGEENPKIDFKGRVWQPNDAAGVMIHNMLDALEALENRLKAKGYEKLEDNWLTIQKRLGMLA